MKISPKLKRRAILAVVILVCLSGAFFYLRLRKSSSPEQVYLKNKLNLAASYIQQGLINPQEPKYFDYAIQQYEEILKFKPNQKEAMLGLAGVYTQTQAYDKAEKLYKKLIRLEPRNASYQISLGFHYLARDMKDEALEKANLAVLYAPRNSQAYLLRAIIYEKEKDPSAAIREYKKSIQAAKIQKKLPQDPQIYLGLGHLFFRTGLFFDAAQQFEKVTRLWPRFSEGYLELASFYLSVRLADKSISVLNSLLAFKRSQVRAYEMLGVIYLGKKDFEAAFANLKKAQSLGAQVSEALLENLNQSIQKMRKAQEEETRK